MPLILLVAILFSLCFIKIKDNSWKSGQALRDAKCQEIESSIMSELEYSLLEKFHNDRWNCVNDISSDLEAVLGENWRDILNEVPPDLSWSYHCSSVSSFVGAWNIAFEIWYSKMGYIPTARHKYNVKAAPLFGEKELDNQLKNYDINICSSVKSAIRESITLKTCQTIEKNIRTAHPSLDLRLCKGVLDIDKEYLVWEYWYEKSKIRPGARPWPDQSSESYT